MRLSPGARLGPYEIVAPIGVGGMGEVYRARDTQLGRDVALKVLPDLFATDADRLARFEREARVLASLNHPNIAAIHGLEDSKSPAVRALVLELVEGPTLADHIARGPIPVDEALTIARQIAEALRAAHERGIVHRDLKPLNIKLRPDGTVKVLDFGLAKAMAGDSDDASASPTITDAGTRAGQIIGTAAYMSPEQARGRGVDKQTDIWAFGCVLFEMLTGRSAFGEDSVSETLSAVLVREPDWSALPSMIPEHVRVLVHRCLEKDRTRRIGDISTALFLMNEPAFGAPVTSVAPASGGVRRTPAWRWAVGGVAALGLVAAGIGVGTRFAPRSAPNRLTRLTIAPSGPAALSLRDRSLAISPDGSRLVYIGNNATWLFVRPLDSLDAVPLAEAVQIRGFCITPDGQAVVFVDQYTLKKVPLAGGAVETLRTFGGGNIQGMACGPDGSLMLTSDANATGLLQLGAADTEPRVLTRPSREQGEADHLWPSFLPGGQAVLFTIVRAGGPDNAQVAVLDLRTGARKVLLQGGSDARYVPTGHLVYSATGFLHAIPFDLSRLEVTGPSVRILPETVPTTLGSSAFDVAADGTLVYVRGGAPSAARTLVWVDRRGVEQPLPAPPRVYQYPRLSPDGTRVAVDVRDQENDIWIWEFSRETLTRFTTDPALDRFPAWTHDGQRLFFASDRAGAPNVYWQATNGAGSPEQITQGSVQQMPMSATPDNAWLVVRRGQPQAFDLIMLSLSADHREQPLLQTSFSEQNAEISPDGRWMAYQANDSGALEVYVRPFPNVNDGRSQISASGGVEPLWSRDGKELFYFAATGALMRVNVGRGLAWTASAPTKLFDPKYIFGGEAFGRSYDIAVDGSRFLMIKTADSPAQSGSPPAIVVVQHWFDELQRLVPAKR